MTQSLRAGVACAGLHRNRLLFLVWYSINEWDASDS